MGHHVGDEPAEDDEAAGQRYACDLDCQVYWCEMGFHTLAADCQDDGLVIDDGDRL